MPRETARGFGECKTSSGRIQKEKKLDQRTIEMLNVREYDRNQRPKPLKKPTTKSVQNWTRCQLLSQLKTETDFSQSEQA